MENPAKKCPSGISNGTLYYFDTLPSTNEYAKTNIHLLNNGDVICSDVQTSGKGRAGRHWLSEIKLSLTFTIVISAPKDIALWPNISQILCLTVTEILHEKNIAPIIKWPNDILVSKKKICGILTEVIHTEKDEKYIIIGCGLNVNTTEDFLSTIDKPAASMKSITGNTYDKKAILIKIIAGFSENLDYLTKDGFSVFLSKWKYFSQKPGTGITINTGKEIKKAVIIDIEKNGSLTVEIDAKKETLYWGEIAY
jgi:BirA family biotin operon repressor/biotin-[acetyl-CoA-carboxylase] ligase